MLLYPIHHLPISGEWIAFQWQRSGLAKGLIFILNWIEWHFINGLFLLVPKSYPYLNQQRTLPFTYFHELQCQIHLSLQLFIAVKLPKRQKFVSVKLPKSFKVSVEVPNSFGAFPTNSQEWEVGIRALQCLGAVPV